MPRSGINGTATPPPGTIPKNPNDIIPSAAWNSLFQDLYQILNTPQPVAYGGGGAATSVGNADNWSTMGSDIPSATATDIGAATGTFVDVTGTATITSFTTATAGVRRTIRFRGAATLTHNATSLTLYSKSNITAYDGLVMSFLSLGGGNWVETSQTPARGSFTPTVLFGGANAGMTFTARSGTYVRHGDLVKVYIRVFLSNKGGNGGTAEVSGLPFPVAVNGDASVGYFGATLGITDFKAYPVAGGSTISLRNGSPTGTAQVTDANFTNTTEIIMGGSYLA